MCCLSGAKRHMTAHVAERRLISHHHRLQLRIIIDKRAAEFAPDARALHAAERYRRVEEGMHIDPYDAGLNRLE